MVQEKDGPAVIEKTQAIVLRIAPVSNTSRIVAWLTADHGKIATVIKGAQRPKSPFLGQVDLFYTCELLFYAHERRHLHIARECCALRRRDGLRVDWRAAAAASYFADLLARVTPYEAPQPALFELMDFALDYLAAEGAGEAFVYWFELKVLAALGLQPRLHVCLECGQALLPAQRRASFALARGGLLCARCAAGPGGSATPVSLDVLAMLAGWQASAHPRAALRTHCTVSQLSELEQLLGQFLRFHLETDGPGRAIALDLLRRKVGAA